MNKNDLLKNAFEEAAKEETNITEAEKHEFSDEFEKKMKNLLNCKWTQNNEKQPKGET